jgi:small subunit ribosomal protein S20
MANHQSAIKRIRSNDAKRLANRYYAKTTRTAVKQLRNSDSMKEAGELLPKVNSMLDKLAKKNVIHKNKAANIKSKLARKVASLKA